MLISDSARVLFVHVQKTAGSTIDRALQDNLSDIREIKGLGRHAHLGRILKAEPALSGYFIFGFVRNPWDRMVSWHQMIVRMDEAAKKEDQYAEHVRRRLERNAFWAEAAAEFPRFEDFILRGPDRFPRMRVPQIDYLTAGDRRADFIGRQESFDADFAAVCEKIGLPPFEPVPRNVDKSERPHYSTFYTDEMRDRIAELFAADIEEFGYTFERPGAQ
ncbi:MAG TPA: sulfotransferase family 2 domain-containing protein [Nocardioides sp.]|nr:sulfotransferase family 2 domain-containing protein [Nocardioides sp.]